MGDNKQLDFYLFLVCFVFAHVLFVYSVSWVFMSPKRQNYLFKKSKT